MLENNSMVNDTMYDFADNISFIMQASGIFDIIQYLVKIQLKKRKLHNNQVRIVLIILHEIINIFEFWEGYIYNSMH